MPQALSSLLWHVVAGPFGNGNKVVRWTVMQSEFLGPFSSSRSTRTYIVVPGPIEPQRCPPFIRFLIPGDLRCKLAIM